MGLWEAMPFITIIAIVAIIARTVIELAKNRAKAKVANKDEIAKIHNLISNMQTDLDDIKTDVRTVVIQMDDLKVSKVEASVVDEKD